MKKLTKIIIAVAILFAAGMTSMSVFANSDNGTNAFETWPGKAMTEGEDGWFSVKVPI